MNINITHISTRNGPVNIVMSDVPGHLVTVADLVQSVTLLSMVGEGLTISGNDPVHQPAALADLVRSLKNSGKVGEISLITNHPLSTLASPMTGVWPFMAEILDRIDGLRAGGEIVDVVALREAQGVRV